MDSLEEFDQIREAGEYWTTHPAERTYFNWKYVIPLNVLVMEILRQGDTDESLISYLMPMLESVVMPAFMAGYYVGGGRPQEPTEDTEMYERVKSFLENRINDGREVVE